MRLAVRSTIVVLCLAIVALAPVAASARPAFDPPRVSINSSSTGEAATQGQAPAVRANPDQQVVVKHQDAVPIPPVLGKTPRAEQAAIKRLKALHYTGKLPVNPAYLGAMYRGYGPRGPVTINTQSPSTRPDKNGFDWGDAAIGAAAGLVLTLLVAGGAMAVSRRRSVRRGSAHVATTA
jgi:hypothetical protein